MNISDKILELTCISAGIWNKNILHKITELEKEDFFYEDNLILFKLIQNLANRNIDIDLNIIRSELIKENNFNRIGGDNKITQLAQMHSIINIDYIIKNLKELTSKRKILNLIEEIRLDINSPIFQVEEIFNKIWEYQNNEIQEQNEIDSLEDILKQNCYIETKIESLDKKVTGLFNSELIIIGARPGLGKTTFSLQLAKNISKEFNILFYSCEMPARELYIKLLSNFSDINSINIRTGKIDLFQREELKKSYEEIKKLNLKIVDNKLTIEKIVNDINKKMRIRSYNLIIVDYLQRIGVNIKENRYIQLGQITRSLKNIARIFDIPVIALSQLSRIDENEAPKLHHLRESGDIEQDADVVYFLYDSRENKKKCNAHEIDLIIAKYRMGMPGSVKLWFDKSISKFSDIDENLNNIKWNN